ncbi:MAG: collagen-like protein [Solirubrobacterales bacterium]|nr:collagen-like protein [Solirubrobacterales bacterium]
MKLSFANVTSGLALFVALGGTSYAAVTITGANVRNGSLTGADVRNGSLTSADVRDGSLRARDFRRGQLRRGPQGPVGARGKTGDPGIPGTKGDTGDKGDAGALTGDAGGALSGTYPAPTLAAGAVTSAALADSAVGADKLGVIPSAKVSGASTTNGAISWSSEYWDTAAMHDTGATAARVTSRYPGYYAIALSVQYSSACTTGPCTLQIEKNGTAIASETIPTFTSVPWFQSVTAVASLQPSDYVTARIATGGLSAQKSEQTSLTVSWIGRCSTSGPCEG